MSLLMMMTLQLGTINDEAVGLGDAAPEVLIPLLRKPVFQLKTVLAFDGVEREFESAGRADALNVGIAPHARFPVLARGFEYDAIGADFQNPVGATAPVQQFRRDLVGGACS